MWATGLPFPRWSRGGARRAHRRAEADGCDPAGAAQRTNLVAGGGAHGPIGSASQVKEYKLGGPGRIVEVDGGYFSGYVKPANHRENPRDQRLVRSQTGKRQCVVVARERDGKIISAAFPSEGEALRFISNHVAAGTEIVADDATSWNALHGRHVVKRINHQVAFSMDGACTNRAESFFSQMCRAGQEQHHHIAGVYLTRYAQERAWREEHRLADNGAQVHGVVALALTALRE